MIFNRFAGTAVREIRHLTKSELAAGAHKSPAYITELEKGDKKCPSLPVLRDLANALDVDVRALYVQADSDVLLAELIDRLQGDVTAIDEAIATLYKERLSSTKDAA